MADYTATSRLYSSQVTRFVLSRATQIPGAAGSEALSGIGNAVCLGALMEYYKSSVDVSGFLLFIVHYTHVHDFH